MADDVAAPGRQRYSHVADQAARRLKIVVAAGSLVLVALNLASGFYFFGRYDERLEAVEGVALQCLALIGRVSHIEGRLEGGSDYVGPPTDFWDFKERLRE